MIELLSDITTKQSSNPEGVICRLQVTGCRLQVAGCRLQVAGAGCRLQVAGYTSQVAIMMTIIIIIVIVIIIIIIMIIIIIIVIIINAAGITANLREYIHTYALMNVRTGYECPSPEDSLR